MGPFAHLATSPRFWRTAMTMSRAMNHLPIHVAPIAPIQAWLNQRTLPEFRGGNFRKWLKKRNEDYSLRSAPLLQPNSTSNHETRYHLPPRWAGS